MNNKKCIYCGDYMRNSNNKNSEGDYIHKKCVIKASKENKKDVDTLTSAMKREVNNNIDLLKKTKKNFITSRIAMYLNLIAIIFNFVFVTQYAVMSDYRFGLMFHIILLILTSFAFGIVLVSGSYEKLEINKLRKIIKIYKTIIKDDTKIKRKN